MANRINRYSLLTQLLTLLTLIVVTVGAYTRLADAGLGCPDWPGCYGSMIVPSEIAPDNVYADIPLEKDKAWIEMIHRYLAGLLGLSILSLAVLAWSGSPVLKQIRCLLTFTTLLLIFQAILGMWTVTWLLHPTIVMLHLLGGMTILSLVWLSHCRIHALDKSPNIFSRTSTKLKIAALIGLIIVVLQIALGGWVSANYAALACPDFPTCQAQWWPTIHWSAFNPFIAIDQNFSGGFLDHPGRVSIHFMHRLGAVVTTIYLVILGAYCLFSQRLAIQGVAITLFLVLGLQLTLGVINVVKLLPMWAAVAHNGVAALLLLVMVTLNYRLFRASS